MQSYLQKISPIYPDYSPIKDLKDQLNLLVANQASFSGQTYIDQLNQILNKALVNIYTKDFSLSIADLCFLPINENHEIASNQEISPIQKKQLENILTHLIEGNFSSIDENGIVSLEDGQKFILGKLLTTEKIDDKPFLSFAMASGDALNSDTSTASFEMQQSNFAQKLFEEIFNCNKTFAELTTDQQQIFNEAIAQATLELTTIASIYPQVNAKSLQKISLMQLSNLASQINETLQETGFHQAFIARNYSHCDDRDLLKLAISQQTLKTENFVIAKDQNKLLTDFWQNYFDDFLASANIKNSGLSNPQSNSSANDLLRLFQGAVAVKLPANQIKDEDKTCFVPTKDDLIEYVARYLNLTKAKNALASQCNVTHLTPITPSPAIPSVKPETPTKNNFSHRINNALQVETMSTLISEIFRLITISSNSLSRVPKKHHENIFSIADTAIRFSVIAIFAKEDKLSTISGLSIASISSFSLKQLASFSYNKLEQHSNRVRQLGQQIESMPNTLKASFQTTALVAFYQSLNQFVFKDREQDKNQTQQFIDSLTIVASATLVAGLTRVLFRTVSRIAEKKINSNRSPNNLNSVLLQEIPLATTSLNQNHSPRSQFNPNPLTPQTPSVFALRRLSSPQLAEPRQ